MVGGFSTRKTSYDKLGRPRDHRFFGVDDHVAPSGYHREELRYTSRHLVAGRRLFGEDNQPIAVGVAEIKYEYDERGRQVVIEWLNAAGQPTAGPGGCVRKTIGYSETNEISEEDCQP